MAIGIGYPEGNGYPQSTTGNTGSSPIGGPAIPVSNAVTLPSLQSAYDSGTPTQQAAFKASVVTTKVIRLGIIGDSFTAPDTPTAWDVSKWWVHALSELGWPYKVVCVSAVGGRTIEDMDAAFASEVAPFLPEVLWVLPGRNNASGAGGTTAASGLVALDSLLAKASAIGCRNIWAGTPCQGSNDTLATREGLLQIAAGLKVRSDAGKLAVVDTASVYRDPLSATGSALTAVLRDPVTDRLHPGAIGGRRLGQLWAATVRGRAVVEASRAGDLVNGPTDSYLVTPLSNRVCQNPWLLGAAGSKAGAGTTTGNVPDSWTFNTPAGFIVALSQYQSTANGRQLNWFSQSISGSTASVAGTTIMQFLSMSSLGLVVGSKVRLRFLAKVTGLSATFMQIIGYANWFTAGYSASGSTNIGSGTYGAGELASGVELVFETPVSTALANSALLQINISNSFSAGAVSGTMDIAAITCEIIP
jgi:hypothetical protein